MNRVIAGVFLLLVVGCADIRVPIAYTGAELQAAKRDVRTCGALSVPDREKISFNLDRAIAWNSAALKHKGAPPGVIEIPEDSWDVDTRRRADRVMEDYKADVKKEKALRSMFSGLLGKAIGVGGGGSLLTMIGLLLRNLQKKKRALAQYDSAFEEAVPKSKRIRLGQTRPDMSVSHEALKNT